MNNNYPVCSKTGTISMIRKYTLCFLLAFTTCFIVFAGCGVGSLTAHAKTSTLYLEGVNDQNTVLQILNGINAERSKQGLASLTIVDSFCESSVQRAAELAVYIPDSTTHTRPNGKNSVTVNKKFSGEICAFGPAGSGNMAKAYVFNWMNSPVHRFVMMQAKFKSVGIAFLRIGSNVYSVVNFSETAASTGLAPGMKTTTKKVEVIDKYLSAKSFSITAQGLTKNKLKKGQSASLTMKYKPAYGAGIYALPIPLKSSTFTWWSSNPKVASVSKAGVVKAKSPGTCRIYAKLKTGKKVVKSIKIKVKK